jgi:hypothetical protein
VLNIFCLGAVSEDYRTKNTLNFFLEKEDYRIFYNDFNKPVSYKESSKPMSIKTKFFKIFSIITNFLYMVQADIIYVFAMQHGSFPIQIAFFFKKKVIVDFFLSFYDTEINDYKHFMPYSKEAKRIKNIDFKAISHSRMVFFLNNSEAEYYMNVVGAISNKINYRILPLCINEKQNAKLNYFRNKIGGGGGRYCRNLFGWGSYVPLQGLVVILN